MRNTLAKLFFGAAITAIVAFGADQSLGTWKLNMEKSKFDPPPGPVKSLTSTREAAGDAVKVTTTGEQADGQAINSSYTAKYDGTDSPVTGAPWDMIALKRADPSAITTVTKKDGKVYGRGRVTISKNGKTMTSVTKGTDASGKAFTNTMVFEKQ
ncbi:MAG: hypothetical protein ACR2NN_02215 [Bryobacteraceae bacterium]